MGFEEEFPIQGEYVKGKLVTRFARIRIEPKVAIPFHDSLRVEYNGNPRECPFRDIYEALIKAEEFRTANAFTYVSDAPIESRNGEQNRRKATLRMRGIPEGIVAIERAKMKEIGII